MTTITDAGAHSSAEATDKIPAMKGSTNGYLTPLQIATYLGSGTFQPVDSDLTAIAALTPSNDDVLQRKAGAWTNRTIAQLLTDLGLGAIYQPLDSDLTAIAALTTTSYGRALLAVADLAALRAILAPSGTPSGSTFLRGDGQWATPSGSGDMAAATYDPQAIADDAFDRANHTGAQAISTVTGLQTALDGKQAVDSDLTSWAGVTRASGFDTFAATPSSANLRALLTDESGTGAALFAGGALGTPASGTLTNATGLPVATGISGLGTGVATALAVNVGSAGAPIVNGGALGTPSGGTLTNCTGYPAATTSASGIVEKAVDSEVRAATADKYLAADHIETASAAVALTDAATVAVDWEAGFFRTLTLTTNRVLGNPTNGHPGTVRTVYVISDGGPDTLTFGNQYGGELPTLDDITTTKAYVLTILCVTTTHFVVTAVDGSPP